MPNPSRKWPGRLGKLAIGLVLLISLLFTFGLSVSDEAVDRSFDMAVDRWQSNPEFRSVAMDYSTQGSEAMRTRLFHFPAKRVVIALRSLPMLPREYAVNPTSRQHYEDFSRGPLSAYLHLCAEQDVHDMAGIFVEAGKKTGRTDADLRHVLDAFKMDFPVAKDAGALISVSDLLRDTDAQRGFEIQEDIGPRLLVPIRALAAELHIPADPEAMNAEQQRAVFDRLDGYIHTQDEELWRTKQLNDFCSGVWAQVYGPPYKTVTVPVVASHQIGQIILFLLLCVFAIRGLRLPKRISPRRDEDTKTSLTPDT